MDSAKQIYGHIFPSGFDWPIARLGIGIDDIVAQPGFEPESWEESGLGIARGGFVALPSGRVVLLQELDHSKKMYGRYETDISADVRDFVTFGAELLVDEVIAALSVSRDVVTWSQGPDGRVSAADFVRRAALVQGNAMTSKQ